MITVRRSPALSPAQKARGPDRALAAIAVTEIASLRSRAASARQRRGASYTD
jgi:hypothetical protein